MSPRLWTLVIGCLWLVAVILLFNYLGCSNANPC